MTATCHRKTLNVTSPTDINPSTIHADAPPQAAIPDLKNQACAAQMRGQKQAGVHAPPHVAEQHFTTAR